MGEGPGQSEDEQGLPFVGRSGQLLDKYLFAIDLDRSKNCYIANIVKCRPPQNRDPLPTESEACMPWLREQFKLLQPKIVVCLGRIASQRMIRTDFSVTKEHGTFVQKNGVWFMGTFHPAALLRQAQNKPAAFADFVALREKIAIPHLCYEPSLDPYGACRLCMVEVQHHGRREMTTSCTLRAAEGLIVVTDTPEIVKHRSILFELYLAEAPRSEVIREMAARSGVTKTRFLKRIDAADTLNNKCVLCGLCVRACNEIMGAGAIGFVNRGPYTTVGTPYAGPAKDCLGCGACVQVCPTKAVEMEDTGNTRVMKSWGGTKVLLAQCSCCGTYYAPKGLAVSTPARITPSLKEEIATLCPACRGKRIAQEEIRAKSGGAGGHG